MQPITKQENYKVIMEGSSNVENTVEDKTPIQTDTQPNKTQTTNIACRAIKCAGKILLSLFTIPIMAVIGTLSGFVYGAALTYHALKPPSWETTSICIELVSVVLIFPIAIIVGGSYSLSGFVVGLCKGAQIANKFSLEPLKSMCAETKDALFDKWVKEEDIINPTEDICRHIVTGTPLHVPNQIPLPPV